MRKSFEFLTFGRRDPEIHLYSWTDNAFLWVRGHPKICATVAAATLFSGLTFKDWPSWSPSGLKILTELKEEYVRTVRAEAERKRLEYEKQDAAELEKISRHIETVLSTTPENAKKLIGDLDHECYERIVRRLAHADSEARLQAFKVLLRCTKAEEFSSDADFKRVLYAGLSSQTINREYFMTVAGSFIANESGIELRHRAVDLLHTAFDKAAD